MDYLTGDIANNVRRRLFNNKKGIAYIFSFKGPVPEFITYEVPEVVGAKPDGLHFQKFSGEHLVIPWTEIEKWEILYPDGGEALHRLHVKLLALGYSLLESQ